MNSRVPMRRLCAMLLVLASTGAFAFEAVIGIVAPRSGPPGMLGIAMANGVTLALERAEDGGLLPEGVEVSLKQLDEHLPPRELAGRIADFALDQDAVMVIGPMSSPAAEVVARLANAQGIPLLTPAISERITRSGAWAFRSTPSPLETTRQFAEFLKKSTAAKAPRVVFPADNPGYAALATTLTQILGGRSMAIAPTPAGIEAAATTLAEEAADLIVGCLDAEPAGALAAAVAMRQAGPGRQWAFCPAAAQPALLRTGGDAVAGALVATDYLPQLSGEANRIFVAAYEQRFGIAPDRWAGIGYTAGLIASEALRHAGPAPNRKTLRLALERTGPLAVPIGGGTWSQDEHRNPRYAPAFFRVRDGRFVPEGTP